MEELKVEEKGIGYQLSAKQLIIRVVRPREPKTKNHKP
jgi:hypothetical protein